MAMDNKDNNSSENNQNRQFTPGDSSRAAHLSPPLAGGQANLLNRDFLSYVDEIIERSVDIQVREMLQKLYPSINVPPWLLPDSNIQARYRLQFINKVKNTTFTTDLVRDENGDPIKVAIYDTYTQSIISPDCFLSSAKVRLMVLNAELWKNKGVNWSRSEFNQSVLREREGKGPILVGRPSLTIRLENGVGTFGNIVFNDNSSWTKSWFRLGVMVDGEGEEGYLNGERVQEGVSELFRIKGCCVKASQKPKLLKLTHNVRCIKKIGKNRASLLQKKKINTVEEFLKSLYNDEPELREILCINSESGKEWESTLEHVTQCADEYHAKCNASNNSSQPWLDANVESGNILNGDSVQRTNVGGFPHDQSELIFDMFSSKYDPDIIMDGSGNPDIIMDDSGNYGSGDRGSVWIGRSCTGRKVTTAVAGLEGLSLEENRTAGENRPE